MKFCLGLQLGGAIGNNLFDRLRLGHVTDFLLFSLPVKDKVYIWPAWNVADGCIVVGTILLMILLLQGRGEEVLRCRPTSGVSSELQCKVRTVANFGSPSGFRSFV